MRHLTRVQHSPYAPPGGSPTLSQIASQLGISGYPTTNNDGGKGILPYQKQKQR